MKARVSGRGPREWDDYDWTETPEGAAKEAAEFAFDPDDPQVGTYEIEVQDGDRVLRYEVECRTETRIEILGEPTIVEEAQQNR